MSAWNYTGRDESSGFPPYIELYGGVNYTLLHARSSELKSVSPRVAYEIGFIARKNTDYFHRFALYSGLDVSRHSAYLDWDDDPGGVYWRETALLFYDSWQLAIPLEVKYRPKKNSRLQFGLGLNGTFCFEGQSYWLYTAYSRPNVYDPSTMTVVPGPLTVYTESGDMNWFGFFNSALADVTFFGGRIAGHPAAINVHYSRGLTRSCATPSLYQSSISLRLHFVL